MKHEWRKHEKEIYLPQGRPTEVNLEDVKYLSIHGKGDPNNNPIYSRQIQILYSLSYAIRMMPKSGVTPDGYFEYTVYPLEGFWGSEGDYSKSKDKSSLVYDIMIRQPSFVNEETVKKAMEIAITKKKLTQEECDSVAFKSMGKGRYVQIMHTGSFDSEPKSFALIDEYINENELKRKVKEHREIYLSDFTKVSEDKLKTVLRVSVE